MKKKYESGDIIRERRQAELSFFCMALRIDLFYNHTKYHTKILNGFEVRLQKPIVEIYRSGDIIMKPRLAELSFLHLTLRIDLFYNPTKYELKYFNGCGVMFQKPK